jgi:type II secretory pathway pseudopilin PulG
MNIIGFILIAVLALGIGIALGYYIYRNQNEKRQANLKNRADDIIQAAQDKAQKVELDARG